jgi:uncharacterized protein YllA (UPF0747 family)
MLRGRPQRRDRLEPRANLHGPPLTRTLRHISFRRLGTSDVHQRFLDGDRDVARFLGVRPRNVDELLRRAPSGAGRVVPREELSDAFLAYAKRFDVADAVIDNARALRDKNVHIVITGQQPGLCGGPLFCLHKVATAIATCRAIERADSSIRAVPVFWNHTDDHDLEEANRLFLVNQSQEVQRFRLDLERTSAPLRTVRCGREINRVIEELDTLIPGSDDRQWAIDLFRARHPDETLGENMARMMFELFGEHGLLVIEPRDLPKSAFKPLERWWQQADEIREVVRSTCDEIAAMGIDLTMDPGATMMFEIIGDHRQPLADGEAFNSAIDLSPGALLRPLWQDACLPTIGFVVGPGELSYLSIVAPLYRTLGVPQPVILPRASLTLVEPSMQRLLARFGWDLPDLDATPEHLAGMVVGNETSGVEEEIEDLAGHVTRMLDQIAHRIQSLDSSMLSALDRARSKSTDELHKLASKLRGVRQDREGTGVRQIRRLCANLRPRGRLQERVLGPLTFLVAHGKPLVDDLTAAADPFQMEHGILEL